MGEIWLREIYKSTRLRMVGEGTGQHFYRFMKLHVNFPRFQRSRKFEDHRAIGSQRSHHEVGTRQTNEYAEGKEMRQHSSYSHMVRV